MFYLRIMYRIYCKHVVNSKPILIIDHAKQHVHLEVQDLLSEGHVEAALTVLRENCAEYQSAGSICWKMKNRAQQTTNSGMELFEMTEYPSQITPKHDLESGEDVDKSLYSNS